MALIDWLRILRTRAAAAKAHDFSVDPPFYDSRLAPFSALAGPSTALRAAGVLMAPVAWIMRTFCEARIVVERWDGNRWVRDTRHPLVQFLDRQPNSVYGSDALWQATVASFVVTGNAYWLLRRDDLGFIEAIDFVPDGDVRLMPQNQDLEIAAYEIRQRGGAAAMHPPRDVVHFRFGLDPADRRMGWSPFASMWREIEADEDAAAFTRTILQNMGVPGIVVAPADPNARPTEQQVEALKRYFQERFTGAKRGQALVLGIPTDVKQFGFNPEGLMLPSLRNVSEERVCAMLGLPAAVVGFGAGMEATHVGATLRELVRLAWVACLGPIQSSLARQAGEHLLPIYADEPEQWRLRFDASHAAAFIEDQQALADRVVKLVQAGILRVDQAQSMLGIEPDPSQAVYLRPFQSGPIPAGQPPEEAVP
jgi:HK97 family phage portal protein